MYLSYYSITNFIDCDRLGLCCQYLQAPTDADRHGSASGGPSTAASGE